MGVRILQADHQYPSSHSYAVMYCSTTMVAFGPVFDDNDGHDAEERIELFLGWLPLDARKYSSAELQTKYSEFLAIEDKLWREKDGEEEQIEA